MPLVSVVVIVFNGERFLEEAVRSVQNQQLADWELVIVDDGSTDRSSAIARGLAAEDDRIRYVHHPGHENRGMSASRNLGAVHCTAPFISFLDADDVWGPSKLSEQLDLLERIPEAAMVSGATLYWYSWDPTYTQNDYVELPGGTADRRLEPPAASLTLGPLRRGTPALAEVLVRRNIFDAVGGFEERFRGLYEDQAFYSKVFLRYPIYISSRVWLLYRQHDASHCRQVSRIQSWRARGELLDWLLEMDEVRQEPRVRAAIRRRRREIPYLILAAPIFELADRLGELRHYVKHRLGLTKRESSRQACSAHTAM